MANEGTDREFVALNIAVLTVSDTRTLEDDKSGSLLSDLITKAGHALTARAIVKDDVRLIRSKVRKWANRADIDVIITTGGTGLTGRDVTPEALRGLFEKEIEGFAVAFHLVSWPKIGTSTVQSRPCAGIIKNKYAFCLPGSPGACKDGWNELLVKQLDYRHRPCNFVELMPRIDEHKRRK
jgi:molybdenum cofactor biosynthesis protein B